MTSKLPFEAVVDAYGPAVLQDCQAVLGLTDADDAWSEIFLSAIEAYPGLPADADVRSWLVTITHRKAAGLARAAARPAGPAADAPEG